MPGRELRYIVLIAVLLVGSGLYWLTSPVPVNGGAHWPNGDQTFAMAGWSVSPEHVEVANGMTYITRSYTQPISVNATLTIITRQNAKLFGAGAEVPLLGNGYEVSPVPLAVD